VGVVGGGKIWSTCVGGVIIRKEGGEGARATHRKEEEELFFALGPKILSVLKERNIQIQRVAQKDLRKRGF
jgi:hypothetical protein